MALSTFLFHCTLWWGSQSERMLEFGERSTWESCQVTVLSKSCPPGSCATGDLVSLCSLVFLDGATGLKLLLIFTSGVRKGEIKMGDEAVSTAGCRRKEHGSGLPVRTVCVLLFKDPSEKNSLWVGDGVLWSSNRLCRDRAGPRERVEAGTVKARGFYTSNSWLLWATLYLLVHVCCFDVPVTPTEII